MSSASVYYTEPRAHTNGRLVTRSYALLTERNGGDLGMR